VVMDESDKKLLKALVFSHPSRKSNSGNHNSLQPDTSPHLDLVTGKGKGLIILLHGPPGVGKTLTAETVAAWTKRPLYPITCGDIGERPSEIEQNLGQHFSLAHRWGCVLLIDEADVFLAARRPGDVNQNALVSGKSEASLCYQSYD
jgi:SpoVK/Ycf46/Vps4 family AAA+-type ATPase